MCLRDASLETPLAGEGEGCCRSQPLGRAAVQLQGASVAGGDEAQGAKLLLQHGGTDKERNVLRSPPPTLRSHPFAVAHCLFNSASCPRIPPETCHGPNIAEQYFRPRAASQAAACSRGNSPGEDERKACATCAAPLQTGEHRENTQNESKHALRIPHPQTNILCLWWECLRPFSTTTECLLTY